MRGIFKLGFTIGKRPVVVAVGNDGDLIARRRVDTSGEYAEVQAYLQAQLDEHDPVRLKLLP